MLLLICTWTVLEFSNFLSARGSGCSRMRTARIKSARLATLPYGLDTNVTQLLANQAICTLLFTNCTL